MRLIGKTYLVLLFAALVAGSTVLDPQSLPAQETEKIEVRKISLGSVVCTTGQQGLTKISNAFSMEPDGIKETAASILKDIYTQCNSGASNVILVRGHNLLQALGSTRQILCGSGTAAEVGQHHSFNAEKVWLVVYLGINGSEPPRWLVDAVEVSGKVVRFTYKKWPPPKLKKGEHHVVSTGPCQFFFWAPIGSLEPGDYSVQLFDADKNLVTLSRLVTVPQK